MNVQPKPTIDGMPPAPGAPKGATVAAPPRARVPVAGPRLLYTWPVEFEVEPWRP